MPHGVDWQRGHYQAVGWDQHPGPDVVNVIGALAMIQFVYVWNQYLWPLLVINDNERQLVQVALKSIAVGATDLGNWGVALAAAVIASIPPLIIFLFLQESFLRGFALTREK